MQSLQEVKECKRINPWGTLMFNPRARIFPVFLVRCLPMK
uniref:Uncharacterized protein n=1 Tax=Anguilla anguilla TaxID=7936 RepID=A0A0E9WAG5_ANGAN